MACGGGGVFMFKTYFICLLWLWFLLLWHLLLFLESFYFKTYAFYWDLLKGVLTVILIVWKIGVDFRVKTLRASHYGIRAQAWVNRVHLGVLELKSGASRFWKRFSKESEKVFKWVEKVLENVHVLKGFAGDTRYIYQPSPRVSSSVPTYSTVKW